MSESGAGVKPTGFDEHCPATGRQALFETASAVVLCPTAVDFGAVADADDQNVNPLQLESVNDAVATHAQTMKSDALPAHRDGIRRSWIIRKRFDRVTDAILNRVTQRQKFLARTR